MKEDLLKIIKHYGVNAQQRQFAEEVFELQEAITTHELKNSVSYEIPLTELIDAKQHIAEEIADVLVLLFQFNEYYGLDIDDISKIMDNKIKRTIRKYEI